MGAIPTHREHEVHRRISVAPMMDVTDRHFRYFIRQISRRTVLYGEMVTTNAVLRGDRAKLLDFSPVEHPVALQLGGDDPGALAECAAIGAAHGYDEVNLNCGCPSERVAAGAFGAVLMRNPPRVAAAVAAMRRATSVPITVKHRIGVDDLGSYEHLRAFVDAVAEAGATRVIVHARIALLNGISPAENRTIPPLRYEDVYRLKAELPGLPVDLNGGIRTLDAAAGHLERVDGAMLGRAAAEDPWLFAAVDRRFYGDDTAVPTRAAVARAVARYAATESFGRGFRVHHALRHVLPLFGGVPGARRWRRILTEGFHAGVPPLELVDSGLAALRLDSEAGEGA
jgi:tRNA-dihydrouridine synthase A